MNRLTSDEQGEVVPSPLVMGMYVYHWTFWSGVLIDVVYTPRFAQFVARMENGSEIVVKDTDYAFADDGDIRAGHRILIVGLGDRSMGNTYYYCGLVDFTSTMVRELGGWLNHIEWGKAREYFGWRTRREAKDGVLAYYTAVFEVLFRVCYGPLGAMFQDQIVPAAQARAANWKFSLV